MANELEPWRKLPRLYIETPLAEAQPVTLAEAQAHYLLHVLRLQANDKVRLFNGQNGEWLCAVTNNTKKSVALVPQERLRLPVPATAPLVLCAAPIKKAHFEYMIEKATELGITQLQPTLTERSQIREVNIARAASIAVEAAEQSERLDIPAILPPVKLPELVAAWPAGQLPLIAAEWGAATAAGESLAALPAEIVTTAKSVALFTGPEGGFTETELDLLRRLPNAIFLRLGPRILRADTAAIAGLACWQAIRGDWQ